MRQLGEQWVEVIDGVKHMVKEAKSENIEIVCPRCLFSDGNGTCNYPEDDCPVRNGCYIKDLGILNDEGLLPMPSNTSVYPKLESWRKLPRFGGQSRNIGSMAYSYSATDCICKFMTKSFGTKQEAINAWNRRV